jgi:glycosyltransferase involved in cell wall biosynthesis
MDSIEEKINNRYKDNVFINNPIPYDETSKLEVILYKNYKEELPYFSIVTPIYNQEKIITRNIESVINNMTEKNFELILIVDACSDNTKKILLSFFQNSMNNPLLTNVLLIESKIPLFETSADNVGFYCSRGDYIIEIQADMNIKEKGFNMKLLKPFLKLGTVIGVSGRGCHDLSVIRGKGNNIDNMNLKKEYKNIDKNSFYVAETCNRGPLILDRSKLIEMNYLDEKNYFLDNSDHDLFTRAFIQKGYICGHLSVIFESPLNDGSTRKPRDPLNQKVLNYKRSVCEKNGFLDYYLKNEYSPKKIRKIFKVDL